MAKAETGIPRSPRGTKPVSVAFFSALDAAPEAQRAAIARAAQVMIRDQLRTRREKAKLASDRARADGKVQPKATPTRQATAPAQPVRAAGSSAGKSVAAKGKAATAGSAKAATPKKAAKQAPTKVSANKAAKATQSPPAEGKAEPQPQPGSAKRTTRRDPKPSAATTE